MVLQILIFAILKTTFIKSYIKELLVNKLIKKDESDFVYIDDQSTRNQKKIYFLPELVTFIYLL